MDEHKFCIKPFNSCYIDTNGKIDFCCRINTNKSQFSGKSKFNANTDSLEDWWTSEYVNYVRKNFLLDNKLSECEGCWRDESRNLTSHRELANKQYKILFKNNYEHYLKLLKKDNLDFPEDIVLAITNLCNLKCQMCSGKNSSKLLIENKELNLEENLNQKEYDWTTSKKTEIINKISEHELSILTISGGEPLMVPEVIELLEKISSNKKSKNTLLHINTNGTSYNKKIFELLSSFKNVRLMLSLDSVGKYNDYVRYPSNWNNIVENIKEFKKLKNAYLYVNTVVSNFTLLYLDNIIKFTNENNIHIKLSKLYEPKHLQISNLPLTILKKSLKKLKDINQKDYKNIDNLNGIIFDTSQLINNYNLDTELYKKFLNMIKSRDNYRKINIKDYMPELAEELFLCQ